LSEIAFRLIATSIYHNMTSTFKKLKSTIVHNRHKNQIFNKLVFLGYLWAVLKFFSCCSEV